MSKAARTILLVAWLVVLGVLGFVIQSRLVISGDLRLFMPAPQTATEKLLLEEIGQGPGSRLLLVALSGDRPESLARSSQALAAALQADRHFGFVANGTTQLDAIGPDLLAYRYLLSPTFDHATLDADFLHSELSERLNDLSSPAGSALEPWIPRDPTLEIVKLAQSWQGGHEPRKQFDVWFDSAGNKALLVVETTAAAFDPQGQQEALQTLTALFEKARETPATRLIASGAGAFGVLIQGRAQHEAQILGTVDTVAMILLLLIAYRSFRMVLLGTLPLASAGVAGLVAVSAVFGTVHGITLAFGFTLIGVAQDYPIHLFSHRHPGATAAQTARSVWPTLATGVASTCIAYLAFLASGVTGLQQLACFTIVGLAVASLTTRFILPPLLVDSQLDFGSSRRLGAFWGFLAKLPRPVWLIPTLAAIFVAIIVLTPGEFWEGDLGKLTPIPEKLIEQDTALRQELGAPDIRYLLAVSAKTSDAVLLRLRALEQPLSALVATHAISGFDDAAHYLAPAAEQLARQSRLPDPESLRAALSEGAKGLPFRANLFDPFLKDVETARHLKPLTLQKLTGTPLELRIGALLVQREGGWTGLVTFANVQDATSLQKLAMAPGGGLTLLDLKEASEDLVVHQRERILWSLAVAAVLLVAVIAIALRSVSRVARVLAPMTLTTLLILAVLHGSGVALNLFHLIALVLAAGLGLDYALFFEHAEHDPHEQRRTLHAVIVCSISTFVVFAVLALSTLPVLRAIGVTVALGVVGNFVLALLLTRRHEDG